MALPPEKISPNQLKNARIAQWHQNGDALRTVDDARTWLETAGLVPYYPHAQFASAPQPSFAEAVLGRPEKGWVPARVADGPSEEESYAVAVEDEEPADEVEDDEDDEFEDEDSDDEDIEDDEAASDDEIMVSADDEFAEDEGDEIAEEDRIHAAGDPVPNDLAEGDDAAEPVAAEPEVAPINGFTPEEKETVHRTLAHMVAEGTAVPLNLLGSTTGEPDFVCSAQAFSFVYTLRGDKGWKQEPSTTGAMRVSPLAAKVSELLKEKGPMAPHELANEAGQGVVDSAILRALSELWAIQRVIPVPDADGKPAKWELMSGRFVRHMKAGANAGQPTALSALLSLYLSQAVAATSDEMEIFLSPLAARSRVREVVGGLAASRQLDSLVVEGKTLLYIPGALDSLPEDEPQAAVAMQRSRYEDDDRRHMIEERAARFAAEGGAPEERRPARTGSYPVRRPAAAGERPARREGGFAPRREGGFAPPRRTGGFAGGRDDRERRPFVRRDEGAAAPSDRPRNEFARPWEDRGERKPFTPREGGDRPFTPRGDRPFTPRGDRPFTPRGDGERRPFTPREGGDRKPFAPRGDRPFTPRGDRPFTPRGDRPLTPREGGDRPFTPRGDRPFTSRGDRPFTPRGDRPFTPREGGDRKPFAPRGDRPFTPRGDGERRPFTQREGGGERRPFAPRGDRPFTPRGDGERRPFTPREGGDRKPFGAGRPAFGSKPYAPRTESGAGRPSYGSKSAGPGGAKFGGSGFGRDRSGAPGGFGRPGAFPARRGPGNGPGRGGAPKRRPE